MKTLYKLLILSSVLLSTTYNYAQIDTTIYYPLEIGDYWQYKTQPLSERFTTITVLGDTTINNNLYFEVLSQDNFGSNTKYFRTEGNNSEYVIQARYNSSCPNQEGLIYDFTQPDSAIWFTCTGTYYVSSIYSHYRSLPFLNEQFYTKTIVDAWVDSTVAPPETTYYNVYYEKLSKGVGLVEFTGEQSPLFVLEGMVLNGIHYGNTSLFVGVDDDEEQVITDFSLHQNYPNPFNPVTKIKYEIPDQSAGGGRNANVKLKVYDVLGNEVATLVSEYKPAGSYEVEFNADGLPSGVYFYKIQAGNYVETKKMVLMK